jgi:DNA-binding transcriptional regulator YiaG
MSVDISHTHFVALLERLDMTNGDIARFAGVDRSTITRWVHGTVAVPVAVIRLLELVRDLQDLTTSTGVRYQPGLEEPS